jgi:hypothetical protein
MRDDHHAVRLARRLPLAREDLDAVDAFEASFSHALNFVIQNRSNKARDELRRIPRALL